MIRTYTGTLMTRDLSKATVKVIMYKGLKYEVNNGEEGEEINYKGVTSWDIIEGGSEAEELEAETDGTYLDEYHEYLVLHFEDGTQATFRNSHVVMFII